MIHWLDPSVINHIKLYWAKSFDMPLTFVWSWSSAFPIELITISVSFFSSICLLVVWQGLLYPRTKTPQRNIKVVITTTRIVHDEEDCVQDKKACSSLSSVPLLLRSGEDVLIVLFLGDNVDTITDSVVVDFVVEVVVVEVVVVEVVVVVVDVSCSCLWTKIFKVVDSSRLP